VFQSTNNIRKWVKHSLLSSHKWWHQASHSASRNDIHNFSRTMPENTLWSSQMQQLWFNMEVMFSRLHCPYDLYTYMQALSI